MTDKAQHTPGPWVVNTDDPPCYAISSEDYGRIALLQYPLAEELQRVDQHKADARLIAAAPELLEALKACESCLRIYGNARPHPRHGEIDLAIFDAKAAIEKATGCEAAVGANR